MNKELQNKIFEMLENGHINVAGNFVLGDQNIENHVENVEQGGVGIVMPGGTVNQYSRQQSTDDNSQKKNKQQLIENLIRQEIEAAKAADKGSKYILLPYKAAIEAGAISDTMNCSEFNSKYDCTVSKSSFTEWIRGTKDEDVFYEANEIEPIKQKFIEILNS